MGFNARHFNNRVHRAQRDKGNENVNLLPHKMYKDKINRRDAENAEEYREI